MNQWQPMIERCNAINRKINELLARRVNVGPPYAALTVRGIDDLETILFAVRYAANSLGEWKDAAPKPKSLIQEIEEKTGRSAFPPAER
jgi:hypothetical protein